AAARLAPRDSRTHTPTTALYPLSLHDALPICRRRDAPVRAGARLVPRLRRPLDPGARGPLRSRGRHLRRRVARVAAVLPPYARRDRKSTRLNSSHVKISYAVFCLKKKKTNIRA